MALDTEVGVGAGHIVLDVTRCFTVNSFK